MALQLIAAGTLRWHGSSRAWLTFTLLSGFLWLAIFRSAFAIPLIWLGPFPLFPLSLIALLLPLFLIALPAQKVIGR